MTEADKYAKGATKPGGYAAQGYYKDGNGATVAIVQPVAITSEPDDTAYLATRPPWTCSVCKVTCTSQDTLLGHAGGVKHRRRVSHGVVDPAYACHPCLHHYRCVTKPRPTASMYNVLTHSAES